MIEGLLLNKTKLLRIYIYIYKSSIIDVKNFKEKHIIFVIIFNAKK
jgi:rRNA pseudouridine-1189 N-methylase Emg1 (Nep1/Mra1 family)